MATRHDHFQVEPKLALSAADVETLGLGLPRDPPVVAQPNNGPNNGANAQAPGAAQGNGRGRAPAHN